MSTPGIRGKRARMLEIGTIYTGTLAARGAGPGRYTSLVPMCTAGSHAAGPQLMRLLRTIDPS